MPKRTSRDEQEDQAPEEQAEIEPTTPSKGKRQYVRHDTPIRAKIRGAEELRQLMISEGIIKNSQFTRTEVFELFGVGPRTGYHILRAPSDRCFGHNDGDVETRGRPLKVRPEEPSLDGAGAGAGADTGTSFQSLTPNLDRSKQQRRQQRSSQKLTSSKKKKTKTKEKGKGPKGGKQVFPSGVETVEQTILPNEIIDLGSFVMYPDGRLMPNGLPIVDNGDFGVTLARSNGVESGRYGGSR